jgi:hypothetical protein
MIKFFSYRNRILQWHNQRSGGDRTLIKCLVDIFREGPALRGGYEIAPCGLKQNINYKND